MQLDGMRHSVVDFEYLDTVNIVIKKAKREAWLFY